MIRYTKTSANQQLDFFFHLGTYKTATSTLQDLLFKNHDYLKKNKILYPKSGTSADSSGRRHAPMVYGYIANHDMKPMPDSIFQEIKKSDCSKVILSSEAWSNPNRSSHLIALISWLRSQGFINHCGILSLRNITDYQLSLYREFTIVRQNKHKYSRYVQHDWADYLKLLFIYKSLFRERLKVVEFDKKANHSNVILKSFEIGNCIDGLEQINNSNVKSYDSVDCEIFRVLNVLKVAKPDQFKIADPIKKELLDIQEINPIEFYEYEGCAKHNYSKNYIHEIQTLSKLSDDSIDRIYDNRSLGVGKKGVFLLTKKITEIASRQVQHLQPR